MKEQEIKNDLIVLVQEIKIEWSKKSRGAPGSIKRNKIGKVLKLPLNQADKSKYVLFGQRLHFSEWKKFQNPTEQIECYESFDSKEFGCVKVIKANHSLSVVWQYDQDCAGAPYRDKTPKIAFILQENEWGQISYNGRYTEEEGWYYKEIVLNVGLFNEPTKDCFIISKPNHSVNQKAHLS